MQPVDTINEQRCRLRVSTTDDAAKYAWDAPLNDCVVKALFVGRNETEDNVGFVDAVSSSDGIVGVVLDRTSFYAEAGGQIFDTGALRCGDVVVRAILTASWALQCTWAFNPKMRQWRGETQSHSSKAHSARAHATTLAHDKTECARPIKERTGLQSPHNTRVCTHTLGTQHASSHVQASSSLSRANTRAVSASYIRDISV